MDKRETDATLPWLRDRRTPHRHMRAEPIYLYKRVIATTLCVLCGRPDTDPVHTQRDAELGWPVYVCADEG